MSRVIVTGATGFVGRAVVPLLESRGYEVVSITRDHAREPGDLVSKIVECAPVSVIHLATHFLSAHRPADIPPLVRANVEFGALVAEAAAGAAAPMVNIGTAWQHVDGRDYLPVSLYAAMKQALVPILDFYASAHGLRVRTVTLFDTYGPRDVRPKLVPSLLRAARDGIPLDMSDGEQLIDLTFIDDVARGIVDIALDSNAPPSCVLRSWAPLSIRELVGEVESAIDRPVPVNWDVRPARPREMREDWVFGTSPPGWERHVSLPEGLHRTWTALVAAGGDA